MHCRGGPNGARRSQVVGRRAPPAGRPADRAWLFQAHRAQERAERRVPAVDGAGGARQLEEPGAGRGLDDRGEQAETRLVEPFGGAGADRGHVRAGYVQHDDVEPVGGERGRRRDRERRAAVGLLHLADPPLEVGLDRTAASPEVEHHQLAVLGVAGDPRQPELRGPHRRRGRFLDPVARRVVAQRRLARGRSGEGEGGGGEDQQDAERQGARHGRDRTTGPGRGMMRPMISTTRHHVRTTGQGDAHDVTALVARAVADSGLSSGLATTSVIGSTAVVTTIEFEPGAVADLNRLLDRLAPRDGDYAHHARWGDDNGSSHVRAALMGPSLTVPFESRELVLGTWQQIVLLECDTRPRRRPFVVQLMGE